MRSTKSAIIFLIIALSSLVIFVLLQNKRSLERREDAFVFDTLDLKKVKELKIIKGENVAHLTFSSGYWSVQPDKFPADTAKVNKFIRTIFKLQNKELVSINPARSGEYGLDSLESRHILCLDEKGKVLLDVFLGKTAGTDYSSTYFRKPGQPEMYRSPGSFGMDMGPSPNDWKIRKLFELTPDTISKIKINWADSLNKTYHVELKKNDNEWFANGKIALKDPIDQMKSRLADMNFDDFAEANDTNLQVINLENPSVSIEVQTLDSKVFRLETSKNINGFVYARYPNFNQIIKISNWRIEAFTKKPDEIIDRSSNKIDSAHNSK